MAAWCWVQLVGVRANISALPIAAWSSCKIVGFSVGTNLLMGLGEGAEVGSFDGLWVGVDVGFFDGW